MYCPNCDHNQGATPEQLENMRVERAKNRAEHHGFINVDVNSITKEMCECEKSSSITDILIDVNIEGNGAYQPICDDCNKAKEPYATYDY